MSKPIDNLTDRELLEKVYEQQRADHKKISALHKMLKVQRLFTVLKWIFYIGIAVGLYSYLQPIIESGIETYRSIQDGAETIREIRNDISHFQFFR